MYSVGTLQSIGKAGRNEGRALSFTFEMISKRNINKFYETSSKMEYQRMIDRQNFKKPEFAVDFG